VKVVVFTKPRVELPISVIGYAAAAVVVLVVNDTEVAQVGLHEVGVNVTVPPGGIPVALNETDSVGPWTRVAARLVVALPPGVTVAEFGVARRV